MTRPPITGRWSRREPNLQGASSQPIATQSAGNQSPVQRFFSPTMLGSHAAQNSEPNEASEEIAPRQYDIRVLHPSRRNGAKWFKNNTEVSTCVRQIIEGCFKGPWYSWKRVPLFYREAWFSTFKTRFEWDASIDNLVKTNFEKLAATRLKGMVSLAKSNGFKPNGEKPEWILSDYWKIMVQYWKTPEAKEKSEKARSSRLSNRDGLGPHCHRAGSRSYAKVQDVLEANNEDSSFIAVMKKTHQKPDGTFVDERARVIAEKYDQHVEELLSQMESPNGEGLTIDSLTLEEKNDIYIKIVGASKQGGIFGLGSLQCGVIMPSHASSIPPETPEEVDTLTRRMQELETELEKSREENVLVQKRLEAMENFCFSTNSHT